MKMPLVAGRDFRPGDSLPGVAIVNETFVRGILTGVEPIGVQIAKGSQTFRVVGVTRDAPYRDLHEAIRPMVFVPFHSDQPSRGATFVVRTASADPLAMASTLRREISWARVINVCSQMELVEAQTVRERLAALLALFFAAVALALAGIGLYGVLDYSVVQRRREIGIRMAIGAQAGDVARRVTLGVFGMVVAGAAAGLGLGELSVRYIAALLYQVKPTDPAMLALPITVILASALGAAVPAVLRAVRVDPAAVLHAE
jgi:putative ABC transport system permease protein